MLHVISTAVMVIVGIGLYFRARRPALHWKLMVAAFLIDVALVLYIEISRHAVEQLPHSNSLVLFHATISLSVLACYIALFVLGSKLLRGRINSRSAHRNAGMAFVALRSLNYVTSFMV